MLFAPTLADKAILPRAWGGRYFFNRIGQKRTSRTRCSANPSFWLYLVTRNASSTSANAGDGCLRLG
ncbi:hypothetical protein CXK98_22210 [Stutzerimonas kunmingensis]|nr:hypothetical protein CXK98_22210 [Stutzerimonas kunmingensis]